MANPKPVRTKEFEENIKKPVGNIAGDYPLGGKPWSMRFPVDIDAFMKEWDEKDKAARIEWMRNLIVENARNLPEYQEWESNNDL